MNIISLGQLVYAYAFQIFYLNLKAASIKRHGIDKSVIGQVVADLPGGFPAHPLPATHTHCRKNPHQFCNDWIAAVPAIIQLPEDNERRVRLLLFWTCD